MLDLLFDPAERNSLAVDDDGLFGDAGFVQLGELLGKHWPAEVISLRFVALVPLEEFQLLLRFHSLGNHAQFQASANANHCGHDGGIVGSGGDLADKRLIDLQCIDRELSKIAQAGIARAEIIDGHAHAAGSQRF
jgi:hypothetical protein